MLQRVFWQIKVWLFRRKNMEEKQGARIKNRLFWISLALFCSGLVVYAITSLWTVQRLSNHSIHQRASFEQILFVDSIRNDVISGPHSEVHRKCEQLYQSGHVKFVQIEDGYGQTLCEISDGSLVRPGPNLMETFLYSDPQEEQLALRVKVLYAAAPLQQIFSHSIWTLLSVIVGVAVALTFAFKKLVQHFAGPISELTDMLSIANLYELSERLKRDPPSHSSHDVKVFHETIENMTERLIEAEQHQVKMAKLEGMAQVASQVAHDIRSPVTALNLVMKDAVSLPERQRTLVRSATQQITDITNNLLIQKSAVNLGGGMHSQNATPELLFALMDNLVSNKRAEYAEALRQDLDIHFHISDSAYGLFVDVFLVEFGRVLSNLINNAVEAMEEKGVVDVCLQSLPSQDAVRIHIKDTGCGMSEELLTEVMKGGVSVGKQDGHGMGLASSKAKVESWGGTFEIVSVPDQGTTVTIGMTTTMAPDWFRTRVQIPTEGTLVVLDDDPTIHAVWDNRFESFFREKNSLPVLHFDNTEDFLAYDHASLESAYYLVDYELLGSQATGLDAIEELEIAETSTLVTSRYEDPLIRKRCLQLGCKILPKNYAPHAPFTIVPNKPDLVLIDDSPLMCMTWEMGAKRLKHQIRTFTSTQQARKLLFSLPKETAVYVDSKLSDDERGEDFAKELHDAGFRNLFLATGLDPSSFEEMPWIKAIVGKGYPENLKPLYKEPFSK